MNKTTFCTLALAFSLGACATITKGTSDNVIVNSDPTGANCLLERGGEQIGRVNPTPGPITVEKSKKDITISCEKEGYSKSVATLTSDFEGMTLGNILLGGLIGAAVDAGTGAMNKYKGTITVPLKKAE